MIASIHAIEPSEGMRNTFLEKTQDERVSIQDGTFTETAEPDGWADAVIVAQVYNAHLASMPCSHSLAGVSLGSSVL